MLHARRKVHGALRGGSQISQTNIAADYIKCVIDRAGFATNSKGDFISGKSTFPSIAAITIGNYCFRFKFEIIVAMAAIGGALYERTIAKLYQLRSSMSEELYKLNHRLFFMLML